MRKKSVNATVATAVTVVTETRRDPLLHALGPVCGSRCKHNHSGCLSSGLSSTWSNRTSPLRSLLPPPPCAIPSTRFNSGHSAPALRARPPGPRPVYRRNPRATAQCRSDSPSARALSRLAAAVLRNRSGRRIPPEFGFWRPDSIDRACELGRTCGFALSRCAEAPAVTSGCDFESTWLAQSHDSEAASGHTAGARAAAGTGASGTSSIPHPMPPPAPPLFKFPLQRPPCPSHVARNEG
jgi:hypothetical protein